MFKHGFMHEAANLLKSSKNTYILLVDVVGFVKFNEDYGFRIGDSALREAVERISLHTTEDMTLLTLAGDEWILFTNKGKYDDAEELAQQILQHNDEKVKYNEIEAPLQLRIAIVGANIIDHRNSVFVARELDAYMDKLKVSSNVLLRLEDKQ